MAIVGPGTGNIVGKYQSGVATPDTLTGLYEWWDLNETSGTRSGSVGNADLTDTNTVGYSSEGVYGNAASFVDGNVERLAVTRDQFKGGQDFSVAVWWKSSTVGTWRPVLHSGAYNNINWSWNISRHPSGNTRINTKWTSPGTEFSVYGGVSSTTGWNFTVGVYDWTNQTISCRVNGNNTVTSAMPENTPQAGNGLLHLGYYYHAFDTMLIDCTGYWTIALDETQIEWLYNGGAGRQYSDLQ